MRTRCVGAVTAGLLLAMCLPAHAIVLRYRPKVGRTVRHHVSVDKQIDRSTPDTWESKREEVDSYLAYRVKALSATEETTRVETRLTDGWMKTTYGDDPEDYWDWSSLKDGPEGPMVMDLDERGRPVKLVSARFEGGAASLVRDLGADLWCKVPATFCTLPEGEVGVNDTWSVELKASMGTLRSESRLLALTTWAGHKCAKVHTEFAVSANRDEGNASVPDREAGGKAKATPRRGSVDWYYDYENSIYAYVKGSLRVDTPAGSTVTEWSVGSTYPDDLDG